MTDTTTDTIPEPPPLPRRRLPPLTSKIAWLVALGLATLIPSTMITSLIDERQANEQEAKQAIAQSWGPAQTLTAPTLLLPFKTPIAVTGHPATTYVRLRPQTLDVEAEIGPERRRRGFFEATVYTATIHIRGTFAVPESIPAADGTPLLPPRSGLVAVSLSDASSVMSEDKAKVDGAKTAWRPLAEANAGACRSPQAMLAVPANLTRSRDGVSLDATLHVRGTGRLQIGGLERGANVTIKGPWPSPSFVGDALPMNSAVTGDGFSARWRIDGIGDAGPSTSACAGEAAAGATIGADLMEPMPIYRMVVRAAKYAPLFVVLGLAAYFLFELSMGAAITILQYALMAVSLSLFALLLVSLGEMLGYTTAYVAAATLVIAQASIFTASVLRRTRPALGFAAMLAGLFGFLYVLLGLENFALLIGSVALFIVLGLVMAVTQRVHRREAKPA